MKNTCSRYSRSWLKVFHHKNETGFFPEDKSLCLISNEEGKFNQVGKLNDLFKINGVYEFMLDYKEHGNIVWQQSVLPTEIKKENTEDVPGLKILFNRKNFSCFAGLKMSNISNSCFDGSNSALGNFRYSIGTISYQNYAIPGPLSSNGGIDLSEVILWIRVPSGRVTQKSCKHFSFSKIGVTSLLLLSR